MIFENTECEFCGQEKEYVASTPFGCYCEHCLRIARDEFERGLDEIHLKKFLDK